MAVHPNSLKAIEAHQVKPGQVLNPKGRPKSTVYEQFQEFLEEEIENTKGERATRLKALLHRVYSDALKGDNVSTRILLERAYGHPKVEIKADLGLSFREIIKDVDSKILEIRAQELVKSNAV